MHQPRTILFATALNWLALVLCFGVTLDRVEDLVFEDLDIVKGFNPAFEEAENPDEHVLLRSASANGSVPTIVTLPPNADSATNFVSLQLVTASTWITSSTHYPLARSSPVSFISPLRI